MTEQLGDGADRRDPENDPFACSLCGLYLAQSERLADSDYCRDCRRESAATPRDGESRDRAGGTRPVPPGVPNRPEGDR